MRSHQPLIRSAAFHPLLFTEHAAGQSPALTWSEAHHGAAIRRSISTIQVALPTARCTGRGRLPVSSRLNIYRSSTRRTGPKERPASCGRSGNVVDHRDATIPARWRADEPDRLAPDRLAKDRHRQRSALLECYAFKFSVGRLDFDCRVHSGAAIVGSWPFSAHAQRSEPMADDDQPLRHQVVLLVSTGLSIMNEEHNARRMSGWCQAFSLITDRWALQHDSRPASIIPRRQPFRRTHDARASIPALRARQKCETKKRQNGRVPY